jgi:uncharacterized protein YggE
LEDTIMGARMKVALLAVAGALVLAVAVPALAGSTRGSSNGSSKTAARTTALVVNSASVSDHTVTVSGSSVVTSKPDEAVISLGVQTQAQNATDALRQNASKMNGVIDAITGAGIDRSDISTDSVSLSPQTNNDGTLVVGYIAQNSVSVTVHDLSKAGPVIDAANSSGANIVNGISFTVSQNDPALTAALTAAVKDAKSRADAMAAGAGATVGDVISITDQSTPQPVPFAYDKAMAAGSATPIEPGTVSTTVTVTAVWALQ